MVPVLEAVPNFSQGRDPAFLDRLVRIVEEAGADVLDRSSDPDHNRSVVTMVGAPPDVEEAAVACARLASREIDLRRHRGVHPRVGALDVLPLVPLSGLSMDQARASARRVGERIAREVGIPVYFYAEASHPPGRRLADLRRGAPSDPAAGPLPPERWPDLLPPGWEEPRLHPSAGAVCVGARPLLLAWNVDVEGVGELELREVASELREAGGGVEGLRTLVLVLEEQGRLQLSMNLEDAGRRDPWGVFQEVEAALARRGGAVVRTEIIGLAPDALLVGAGAHRLRIAGPAPPPLVSSVLAGHLSRRAARSAQRLLEAARAGDGPIPHPLRAELGRMARDLITPTGSEKTE
jgi:glutamate formiminotransferase